MPQLALSKKRMPSVEKRISAFRRGKTVVHFWGVDPADESTNWNFNRKDSDTFKRIVSVLPPRVTKLLMPRPTFSNGEVVSEHALTPYFTVDRVQICGGVDADGCVLMRGESTRTALAIASADCATLVAHSSDDKVVIAAHAGRDSVLDRNFIESGIQSRVHFGIVDSILAEMQSRGYQPNQVFMGIFGGIRSHFEHHPENTKYGRYNRGLIEFCRPIDGALLNELTGEIDMYLVIRDLACRQGVPDDHIVFDNVDTGSDCHPDDTPIWASHRHGTPGMRNLIVVHPS